MGGGKTRSAAAAIRTGSSVLMDLGGASAELGGAAVDSIEFCARTHEVTFALAPRARIGVGDIASLIPGLPAHVSANGEDVGVVEGPLAGALTQCLVDGWAMQGEVVRVEPRAGLAVAEFRGTKD